MALTAIKSPIGKVRFDNGVQLTSPGWIAYALLGDKEFHLGPEPTREKAEARIRQWHAKREQDILDTHWVYPS